MNTNSIINRLKAEIDLLVKKEALIGLSEFPSQLSEIKSEYIKLINSVIEDSQTLIKKLECEDIMHERLQMQNESGKLILAPNKVQIFEAKIKEQQC